MRAVLSRRTGPRHGGGYRLRWSGRRGSAPSRPAGEVGTHTLRHSYARHLLMHGVPINYLSRWLGHSSIQTTLIYLELCRILREVLPRCREVRVLLGGLKHTVLRTLHWEVP